jgi:dipeptidyl aminopeptidase/acylaminoacyl peptidase
MPSFRSLLAFAGLAAAFGAQAQAPAAVPAYKSAAEIPVEVFFKRPQYTSMALSPSSTKLAAIVPFRGRNNLVVIDLKARSSKVITGYEDFDVANFEWISDTRLCLRAADGQDVSGAFNYRGAACVDHDGQNHRNFAFRRWAVLERTRDGSPDVFVATNERTRNSVDVYRLNTVNGRGQLLTADSPGEVQQWVLDHNNVPRVAVSSPEPKERYGPRPQQLWYRDGEGAKWEKLFEFDPYMTGEDIDPLAFDFDNQTLYVAHNFGRDKKAIYKYDTKARKMGEMLFEHPLVDVSGGLVFDRSQKKLVGIRYDADKPGVKWLDPELDKLQKMLDATFPKTINVLGGPLEGGKLMLVRTFSDTEPGMFHLLDRSVPSIEPLMKTREWIDPALMSERKFIKYKARDGLEIPAWVTIPKESSGKNLPLIVHIHGGPHVRGYTAASAWGRPEAQFLASRGYVVLEPEPRGSRGYGKELYVKSFKQWGQSMQDDITDGALHLVKEGIVDKSRMCLFGGSYGGYASAMGLVKDPDLWKCGAPYVAVTDLFLLQEVSYTDVAEFAETAGFKKVIGDRNADKEMFSRNSPALQASRIKAPVFLAMGSADVRVPMVHGTALRDAIQKNGGKVDFVVYNGEAHGWNKDENVFDFHRRLEKFFAENLKK